MTETPTIDAFENLRRLSRLGTIEETPTEALEGEILEPIRFENPCTDITIDRLPIGTGLFGFDETASIGLQPKFSKIGYGDPRILDSQSTDDAIGRGQTNPLLHHTDDLTENYQWRHSLKSKRVALKKAQKLARRITRRHR
jgi:hypothetical protein